ncbi:MAG: DUF2764 family protein [Candidatus Omnitrophica bacterium]|nr:DUF2764 family protein [Candidatus Omnitrophota bacterium]
MSKYYYLAASLPSLKFGEELPVSAERFLYECRKWMEEDELGAVMSGMADTGETPEGGPRALKEWKDFDRDLKHAIAGVRKAAKAGGKKGVPEELKAIFGAEDPLAAEIALERKRWDFLESIRGSYQFDINWLVLYGAKLKIAERLRVFDKDKGESVFYNLCEVTYEQSQG